MLRPLHFVLLIAAIAFVVSTPVPGEQQPAQGPGPSQENLRPEENDLEADASGWGYAQPWRYSGGWYGRGGGYYNRGWGGNALYSRGYYGGRGYGWW